MKRKFRLLTAAVLMVGLLTLTLAGCGSGTDEEAAESAEPSSSAQNEESAVQTQEGSKVYEGDQLLSGLHHVEIDVKDYGTIALELDADTAPQSVSNFIALADSGFYDGLTFHRIIDGFMIQGGDPEGTGMGGSEDTITGEFAANGIENPISHVRGVISMARSQAYNSASSQFFIVQQDSTYLDGQYAAFGKVTSGMEIVDAIAENTPVQDDNGTVLAEDQPVMTAVRVID